MYNSSLCLCDSWKQKCLYADVSGCVFLQAAHLWREKPVYPAGEEWLAQDAADRRSLPGVASEQLAQHAAQVLGVVRRDRGVGAPDDLQNQVLHVPRLELREATNTCHTN